MPTGKTALKAHFVIENHVEEKYEAAGGEGEL